MVVLLLPFILFFHQIGFETFEWPAKDTVVLMAINGLIGTFISDYCWAQSVVLLGPLVTTLGMTICFPISGFYDKFANKDEFTPTYLIGSFLIFTAFGVISYLNYQTEV